MKEMAPYGSNFFPLENGEKNYFNLEYAKLNYANISLF